MSRRDAIAMSEEEIRTFLDEERTVVVGTIGRDEWPHLMPLWYFVAGRAVDESAFARPDFAGAHQTAFARPDFAGAHQTAFARPDFAGAHQTAFARPDFAGAHPLGDVTVWSWTYAASQKVRNLERDPRCTLQVEAGTQYGELRGVMLKAECVLHREIDEVSRIGAELAQRYGGADLTEDVDAAMRKQAAKRVGLEFVTRQAASWDHRKLKGTY